jgi:hypothetical protein
MKKYRESSNLQKRKSMAVTMVTFPTRRRS